MASIGPPPTEPPPVKPLEEPPAPPPADVCPTCGAGHEPDQEYCLECGNRLPRTTIIRRELWSRDSPAWLWAALAALFLVALAGTVLALVLTNNDKNKSGTKVVSASTTTTPVGGTVLTDISTSTLPSTLTINPTDTTSTAIIPTLPTTINMPTTTTAPTTTSQTPVGLIRWPDHNGWTIVLQSDPKNQGRTKPDNAAQRALDAGLQQVGILDSTNYSSLNRGYYVVFTGVYGSQSEASSQLNKARSAGFPLAYTRYVAR